eukprot:7637153-Lingulodinium_polyedra.AAC.2
MATRGALMPVPKTGEPAGHAPPKRLAVRVPPKRPEPKGGAQSAPGRPGPPHRPEPGRGA